MLKLIGLHHASDADRARGVRGAEKLLQSCGVTPQQGWAAARAAEAFEPVNAAHLAAWHAAARAAIAAAIPNPTPRDDLSDAELIWIGE